jgi:D-3-phosphoglycerate dehydrogenase
VIYKVVIADRISDAGLQLLQRAPELKVVSTVGEPERLPSEVEAAHALIVRSETQVTEDLLAAAPELVLVARAGIGVDNINVEAATRRNVAVLNAPGANTVSAAEQTFALLLALLRKVTVAVQSMRMGEWDRKRFIGTELNSKTLSTLGLGRIGQRVAGIARAFGMEVLACDPYVSPESARNIGVTLTTLEDALKRADVVSLHMPLTDVTRKTINAERLALMKPTAVLVNTARGGLVDEQALAHAVETGQLAGAALDVFETEPLPADSPLRSSNKIVLTPHLAASTTEAQERVATEICEVVRQSLLTGNVDRAVNLEGITSGTMR